MDGPSANGMLHGRIFIVHVSRAGLFWSKLILQRKEIWLRSSDEKRSTGQSNIVKRVGGWPGPSTATGWLAAVNAAVETCCCCRPASETEICPDRIRRRPSFPERIRFSCIEFRRQFGRNRRTFAAEIAVDCRPWCPIR